MVKNTAWSKNQLREIRHTLGRYLAIAGIVALGVGFFAGLKVTQPAMLRTGSKYTDDTGLYDLRLISTLGLTREDEAYFAGLPQVERAEGASSVDAKLTMGDREVVLKLLPVTSALNQPQLIAGEMPQSENACLADAHRFSREDIGKTLRVTELSRDGALAVEEFTIVGLCTNPTYLNVSRGTTSLGGGSLNGFLCVPKEAFAEDYYTEIDLRLAEVDRNLYSEEYDRQIAAAEPEIQAALEQRAQLRYDSIVEDARQQLSDARKEYEDGLHAYETQRADAEAALQEALQELEDGEARIRENRRKLTKASEELEQAKADLEQGKTDYEAGLAEYEKQKAEADAQLADAQAQIDENREKVEKGLELVRKTGLVEDYQLLVAARDRLQSRLEELTPEDPRYDSYVRLLEAAQKALDVFEQSDAYQQYLQLLAAQAQLNAAQGELDAKKREAEAELNHAWQELEAAQQAIQDGEQQIADGEEEISRGYAQLSAAEKTLAEGREEYEKAYDEAMRGFAEAEEALDDGKRRLEDAELELEKLDHPDVYLLDRETNAGYVSFRSDSGIVDGIARVFPLFFFLVAVFVCITTMTRMVDEQRTQIGTLKAMGYSDGRISAKYMLYSGSAALIGCVSGFLLGTRVFPWVIWKCYDMLYGFAPLEYYFSLPLALESLAASMACSVGTTWLACRNELRKMPAMLMRPKAPKAGKRILLERIPLIWNRLSFLYKVSVRNIVRYKKRLFMMLVGIGGCTALIATGLGIKDSIANIVDDQFNEITVYDISASFSVSMDETRQLRFREEFGEDLTDCVFVGTGAYDVRTQNGICTVNIVATSDPAITNVIGFHLDGTEIPFPDSGAVIDRALADQLEAAPGDSLRIIVSDTESVEVPIAAICDNHLYHYAYMSAETYERCFGEPVDYRTAYMSTEADPYVLGRKTAENRWVSMVSVLNSMRETVDNMMKSLNAMVFVVIGSACALAFIVIYNLSNITINERVREIATIKVLGFYAGETQSYVFREILILTVLGAVIGLPLGKGLHAFVMAQIRVEMVSFTVRIGWLSYLLAFGFTVAMALVTGLMLRRKIERVNMAESLKSVE